jgi:hypothetical protein
VGADGCGGAPLLKRNLFLLSSLARDAFFPVGIFDFCRSEALLFVLSLFSSATTTTRKII